MATASANPTTGLQKFPPPPSAIKIPQLNRWLIEVSNILNSNSEIDGGAIDLSTNSEFETVQTQAATATTDIASLQTSVASLSDSVTTNSGDIDGLQTSITTLQNQVTTLQGQVSTLRSQVAALQALPVVLNGSGVPAGSLGANGDWYADTVGHHIYVMTGGTWVEIV